MLDSSYEIAEGRGGGEGERASDLVRVADVVSVSGSLGTGDAASWRRVVLFFGLSVAPSELSRPPLGEWGFYAQRTSKNDYQNRISIKSTPKGIHATAALPMKYPG